MKNWTSFAFHSSNPGSIASPWTLESCNPTYPNGTGISGARNARANGCKLGALPVYIVNATEAHHIQTAIKFADRWDVRLTIKNTGHDSYGSIWTHNLKGISISRKWIPQVENSTTNAAEPVLAATIGAGVQDGELFNTLVRHDLIAVGGTNMDVGFVGWASGGGHGYMTGKYGMGADNILQAVIVTADGKILIVNEHQHQDLFWAIRGGGGGTFGVIISATVKAYPLPSMTFAGLSITAKNETTAKDFYDVISRLHALFPAMQDKGISGYYTMSGPPSSQTLTLSGSLFLWNGSNETFFKIMEPIQEFLHNEKNAVVSSITTLPLTSFKDLLANLPDLGAVPVEDSITASRLITKEVVFNKTAEFAETLRIHGPQAKAPKGGIPNVPVSGILTISRKPVDNALNPSWRKAVVHLILSQSWSNETPDTKAKSIVKNMTYNKLDSLRQLDLSSGAYLNEANAFEPGWQQSFFGQSYPRLNRVKEKYDPNGVFWCFKCVGSEDWVQQSDGRLCKAANPFY
ncbi:hypothetical protein FOMG_02462 [Fusarium oxysporum f. sp. melonis 26406]|uniref:FAD-binding PCMH-type domain-containing protein n=1 Tax=Fusarium oxysporum f. sp. melonis 26406 TaxID=1089452 RepID=X0BEL8_FUSOX|nr:hypothetical protein FOMG_02462 [Fusarium oxysporum f. sp. melonis 26406]